MKVSAVAIRHTDFNTALCFIYKLLIEEGGVLDTCLISTCAYEIYEVQSSVANFSMFEHCQSKCPIKHVITIFAMHNLKTTTNMQR